ncbi:hypothetical protein [Rubrolithibacter danxiaensis]
MYLSAIRVINADDKALKIASQKVEELTKLMGEIDNDTKKNGL